MQKIVDLIKWYEENATRKEDNLIKIKLKMINNLLDEIDSSEDKIFMEEIISAFSEIVEIQRSLIGELETEGNCEYHGADIKWAGAVSGQPNFVAAKPALLPRDIPWSQDENDLPIEILRKHNPYLPPTGGFKTDEQVRKAFSNYLKYHTVKETKDGRRKPFSKYTVFDYCSRINILWKSFYAEWQDDKLEGMVPEFEDCILPGSTFLNAFQNIRVLQVYLDIKNVQVREIAAGLREPFSEEEMMLNPLNSAKNLGNTVAALAKFAEFRDYIYNSNI